MANVMVGPPRRFRIQGSAGTPAQPQQVQQQPPAPPSDFGPLDEARQRMGFTSQQPQGDVPVQGAPPPLDLSQLRQHGLSNGGAPQPQQGAPSYAQPGDTAPVAINAPNVRTPPGRGIDLPNGGGYRVDNAVYRSSDDYADQRAGRIMQNVQQAGMMGVQNGLYAPTGDDQGAMLAQQQANYGRGAGGFVQAMAAQNDEEKQALMKQLGLGELGVKQGALALEGQKAQSAQALGRAEIASKEAMLGRSLTSQEKQEAMKVAGSLEGHRIQGQAQLGVADVNQRGMRGASMDALVMQGLGDFAGGSAEDTANRVKRGLAVRDMVREEGAANHPGSGASYGLGVSPEMSKMLSEYLPQYGQGGNVAVSGGRPAVGVNGQTAAPPKTAEERLKEQDVKGKSTLSTNAVNEALGITVDPKSFKVGGLDNLKNAGNIINTLAEKFDTQDLTPDQIDSVLRHARNAGIQPADLHSDVAKNIIRLNRAIGDKNEGGYSYASGNSEGETAALSNPWVAAFQELRGGANNQLTLRDRQGKPVFQGSEGAGAFYLPQYMSGTMDFSPTFRGSAVKSAQRQRRVAELLMDRIIASKGQERTQR